MATESLISIRLRGVLIAVILHFVLIPPLTAISEPGKWILNVNNVSVSPPAVFRLREILSSRLE